MCIVHHCGVWLRGRNPVTPNPLLRTGTGSQETAAHRPARQMSSGRRPSTTAAAQRPIQKNSSTVRTSGQYHEQSRQSRFGGRWWRWLAACSWFRCWTNTSQLQISPCYRVPHAALQPASFATCPAFPASQASCSTHPKVFWVPEERGWMQAHRCRVKAASHSVAGVNGMQGLLLPALRRLNPHHLRSLVALPLAALPCPRRLPLSWWATTPAAPATPTVSWRCLLVAAWAAARVACCLLLVPATAGARCLERCATAHLPGASCPYHPLHTAGFCNWKKASGSFADPKRNCEVSRGAC